MCDEPESMVLLRRLEGKLDATLDQVQDLTRRMTALDGQLSRLAAAKAEHHAGLMVRLDRVEAGLGRIERRLDLVPAP